MWFHSLKLYPMFQWAFQWILFFWPLIYRCKVCTLLPKKRIHNYLPNIHNWIILYVPHLQCVGVSWIGSKTNEISKYRWSPPKAHLWFLGGENRRRESWQTPKRQRTKKCHTSIHIALTRRLEQWQMWKEDSLTPRDFVQLIEFQEGKSH